MYIFVFSDKKMLLIPFITVKTYFFITGDLTLSSFHKDYGSADNVHVT